MTVRMLSTRCASRDGRRIEWFRQGAEYSDLPDSMSAMFVSEGWAEPVVEEIQTVSTLPAIPPAQRKAIFPPVKRGKR